MTRATEEVDSKTIYVGIRTEKSIFVVYFIAFLTSLIAVGCWLYLELRSSSPFPWYERLVTLLYALLCLLFICLSIISSKKSGGMRIVLAKDYLILPDRSGLLKTIAQSEKSIPISQIKSFYFVYPFHLYVVCIGGGGPLLQVPLLDSSLDKPQKVFEEIKKFYQDSVGIEWYEIAPKEA